MDEYFSLNRITGVGIKNLEKCENTIEAMSTSEKISCINKFITSNHLHEIYIRKFISDEKVCYYLKKKFGLNQNQLDSIVVSCGNLKWAKEMIGTGRTDKINIVTLCALLTDNLEVWKLIPKKDHSLVVSTIRIYNHTTTMGIKPGPIFLPDNLIRNWYDMGYTTQEIILYLKSQSREYIGKFLSICWKYSCIPAIPVINNLMGTGVVITGYNPKGIKSLEFLYRVLKDSNISVTNEIKTKIYSRVGKTIFTYEYLLKKEIRSDPLASPALIAAWRDTRDWKYLRLLPDSIIRMELPY